MIKRIKQISFSLGIIGFIPALFLFAQILGMGMRTDALKDIDSRLSGNSGLTTLEELAIKYGFISICFLLFILLLLMRNQVVSKVVGLIPLVFMILQCGLLIKLKKVLFDAKWAYSNWLEITYYMDFGFLTLAVLLLILQIYLIWSIYRSSIFANSFGKHRSEIAKWTS